MGPLERLLDLQAVSVWPNPSMPGNISEHRAENICAGGESFAWHEFIFSKTVLTQTIPGHFFVKWLWWPFPPGRPPGTSSVGDWKQLFSTDTGHPSSFRPKISLRPSSFTGAGMARRTSTRNIRNWYFPMPCAVLEGHFGKKKTQHLVPWIMYICFSVIFIISGIIPN